MINDILTVNNKGANARLRHCPKGWVRLLSVQQAAAYLGTTVSTLYSKVWRREIPFIKLGRSVRFDLVDLDELIEKSKVKPWDLSASNAQVRK